MKPEDILAAGLAQLNLRCEPGYVDQLLGFVVLLEKWNRVYNLTQVEEGERTISHHLLDSLSIAPYIAGDTVIDIGSGGGLPGIPLAVCLPGKRFTLLDSNGKKARFLEQVRISLNLANVTVIQERAEACTGRFDIVTCRALAPLAEISRLCSHLLAPAGQVLAMKGELGAGEIGAQLAPLEIDRVIPIQVPGIGRQRNLVVMKLAETNKGD